MGPCLETDRLLLRPFRREDTDAFHQMCSDSEVMRYINGGRGLAPSESWRTLAALIGHWQLRGYGHWAVELRGGSALIGFVGLWYPEGWPGPELGWRLNRTYWGQGYATEGARAAMRYGFEILGHEHLISIIHPKNKASIRVSKKLEMQLESTARVSETNVVIYGRNA